MEKKKRRYWIPAVLILLVLAAVFGGRAGHKLKAKSTLTSALGNIFSQLGERFREDPILILLDCYQPEGKYTANMEMVTQQELLGTITYNMTVDVDLISHQIQAAGIAGTPNQSFDLSLYLDPRFMAVASDELAEGEYYGITYDTFSSDFQKVPLLNVIVNDTVLARWDDSIQSIQAQVSRDFSQPQIPELHQEELRKLLLGVAAMPCQMQKSDILIGEQTLFCTELDYAISGEQVAWALSSLTGESFEKNSTVHFSFYLYEDTLVRFTVSGVTGDTPFQYCFDLGLDSLRNPLSLTGSYGTAKSLSVTVSTQSSETRYAESWDIHTIAEGQERDHSFAFDWEKKTGDLSFRSRGMTLPIQVNFQKAESGLRLETQDLSSLLGLLLQEEQKSTSQISGVFTISRGSAIETPSYKNLDQWSMQDFLTLLAGVGSLIGIRLE